MSFKSDRSHYGRKRKKLITNKFKESSVKILKKTVVRNDIDIFRALKN